MSKKNEQEWLAYVQQVRLKQAERIKELEAVANALIKTLQISLPLVAAPLRETFEIAIAKAKDNIK